MKISLKVFSIWQKLTTGSISRQIFGAAITIALFTAFVKVASVVKELVVAWKFGTSDVLDAFFIALVVPNFIVVVIASAFNNALIPIYIQTRERQGIDATQKLFSGVEICSLGLLLITTLLMVATAPFYLPLIAGGFSPQKLDVTFKLLCVVAPWTILSGISSIWTAVLNAGERFALAAISPIISPAITILFLLLISPWGVFALALGLVFGTALEIILLGAALHRQGILLVPKWYGFSPSLRQVITQYFPALAGSLLMGSTSFVDQSMAAMLSPGSVAALNYGNKMVALPISLATTALTAVIPYFSKMIADKDWVNLHKTFKHYLQIVFVISVPLTGLLIIFSKSIVKHLFERGSFTANDTILVSQIQNYFALQIPFYIGTILMVHLISAMQKNQYLMWGASLSLFLNTILNYIFMKWLGAVGIALSTSSVIFSVFCLFLFLGFNRLKQLSNKS